jgi:RNA polymerase sigma factor (sigma-70 family)
VLAAKAHLLPRHESLGPWLHAVAIKVALKANARATIRRIREQAAARSILDSQQDSLEWRDLRPVLDNAVARLPSKYRVPFVLCYLQGKTVSEIAQQLSQPKGTVASRLTRARAHLRARLIRQGITLSAAGLATALAECKATAGVPRSLVSGTIKSARLIASGGAAAASIPNHTVVLMEGAIRMMMITNLKLAAGILVAAALGVFVFGYHSLVALQSSDKTNVIGKTSLLGGTTNPAASDEPTGRLPSDLPAQGQGELRDISLLSLRRTPIDVYRLGPGDTLGLVIDSILGDSQQPIPVRQGETSNAPPSLGYPVVVREDGTISMPQVPPIKVEGMSIAEVEKALRDAYTVQRRIIPDSTKFSAIVTLARKRTARILVIRQDYGGSAPAANNSVHGNTSVSTGPKRGSGQILELPIGENDLITALAKTGGIPGADAVNEVVIERTRPVPIATADAAARSASKPGAPNPGSKYDKQTIRIPLRLRANDPIPFTEEDITLQNGDIVFIAARSASK